MPVYKTKEEYLRQAIESVLAQTFTDFEFLILDDCPEDDREKIVKSYADKRIKYFKNEKNLGISEARNKLLTLAKGEYLAVFDHDDISYPTRFEKQAAYLDEHPEAGVVSGWVRHIPKNKIKRPPEKDDEIRMAQMSFNCISHSCTMLRKSALTKNKIAYEQAFSPAEDYALYARLMGVTQFHIIPEVLLDYRIHPGNTSRHQTEQMKASTQKVNALLQTLYPELYKKYQELTHATKRLTLFGLPFLKFVRCEKIVKVYLFDRLFLFSYRNKKFWKLL